MSAICKKSTVGTHLFFCMTGRCMYCGKRKPSENLFQRQEYGDNKKPRSKKLSPGKLGVYKIGRLSVYQGCWEVRGKNENKSRWMPFTCREDAVAFLKRKK